METLQRARFNLAVTPATVISVITIIIMIAIGFAVMGIVGSLDIVDDPIAKAHINNTTAYYAKIVVVLLAVVIIGVIFLLINEVRGK